MTRVGRRSAVAMGLLLLTGGGVVIGCGDEGEPREQVEMWEPAPPMEGVPMRDPPPPWDEGREIVTPIPPIEVAPDAGIQCEDASPPAEPEAPIPPCEDP